MAARAHQRPLSLYLLRLSFAYNEAVPNVSCCLVSFTDTEGIQHTVEVSASSLYEAAALGVAEFKRSKLMDSQPGPATRLSVTVKSPTTHHELTMAKLQSWPWWPYGQKTHAAVR